MTKMQPRFGRKKDKSTPGTVKITYFIITLRRSSLIGYTRLTIFIQTVIISKASNSDEDKLLASRPRRPKPRPVFSQAASTKPAVSRYGLNSPISTTPTHWQAVTGDVPSSGDSNDWLPEFAHSAWVSRFLPTLYTYLGSLERPWELSQQGSDDVKAI